MLRCYNGSNLLHKFFRAVDMAWLNENYLSATVGLPLNQIRCRQIWFSEAGENTRAFVGKKGEINTVNLAKFRHLPFFAAHTNPHHLDLVLKGMVGSQHGIENFVILQLLQTLMTVFVVDFDEDVFAMNIFQRNGSLVVLNLQIFFVSDVVVEQYQMA